MSNGTILEVFKKMLLLTAFKTGGEKYANIFRDSQASFRAYSA